MRLNRTLSCLAAIGALSACASVGPLKPAAGHALPVKPLMARMVPTPEELLTPPTYARPERIDELMKRSQPRQADRFDLPPPDGGAAPIPPGEAPPPTQDDGAISPP